MQKLKRQAIKVIRFDILATSRSTTDVRWGTNYTRTNKPQGAKVSFSHVTFNPGGK